MASIDKSADVRPVASASALATENKAPKAAAEQLFCVSDPGAGGGKPPALPAFLPPSGLFGMTALGDHLGERFPGGAFGLWGVGGTAKAGVPVLLQDRAGALHVRLFEPRGAASWAGVSTSATHAEMSEADGARILARLRWPDEDFKSAMAAFAGQLGCSVEIAGDQIRFFGGFVEYEQWCAAVSARAKAFAQSFATSSVEAQ